MASLTLICTSQHKAHSKHTNFVRDCTSCVGMLICHMRKAAADGLVCAGQARTATVKTWECAPEVNLRQGACKPRSPNSAHNNVTHLAVLDAGLVLVLDGVLHVLAAAGQQRGQHTCQGRYNVGAGPPERSYASSQHAHKSGCQTSDSTHAH